MYERPHGILTVAVEVTLTGLERPGHELVKAWLALALTVTYFPAAAPEAHVVPHVAGIIPVLALAQPHDCTGRAAVTTIDAPPFMAVVIAV